MTRDKIIKVATQHISKNGFIGSSMRDIASQVGIEASSLYSHFSSKEAILAEICLSGLKSFIERLKNNIQLNRSVVAQLEAVVEFMINENMTNWDLNRVLFNDYKHLTSKHLDEFKRLRKELEKVLGELLQKGIKSNKFKNHDPDLSFVILLALANLPNLSSKKYKNLVDKNLQKIKDILLHGLIK